jgi:uncharacterized protein DUF3775
MLTIPLEKLAYIIEKAREFDAEMPSDAEEGSNAADDEWEILLDTPDNPRARELRSAIDGLNIDGREELLTLAWLGRGDYDAENWSEASRQARQTQTATETDYLLGTPLLADYLEGGLPSSASRSRTSKEAEAVASPNEFGAAPAALRFQFRWRIGGCRRLRV